MHISLTPDQQFAQDCAALLADQTLALWEKVERIADLARDTIAFPLCLSCAAPALFCEAHVIEAFPTCVTCGDDVPRILCADCHREGTAHEARA